MWKSIVEHCPRQMMSLILDIERYPHFIPFCERVRIIERIDDSLKAEVITPQKWSYISRVTWTEKKISIEHSDFFAQWEVCPLRKGCLVTFRLDLTGGHFIKKHLLKGGVSFLAPQVIKAFIERADFLYGNVRGVLSFFFI